MKFNSVLPGASQAIGDEISEKREKIIDSRYKLVHFTCSHSALWRIFIKSSLNLKRTNSLQFILYGRDTIENILGIRMIYEFPRIFMWCNFSFNPTFQKNFFNTLRCFERGSIWSRVGEVNSFLHSFFMFVMPERSIFKGSLSFSTCFLNSFCCWCEKRTAESDKNIIKIVAQHPLLQFHTYLIFPIVSIFRLWKNWEKKLICSWKWNLFLF